MGPKAPKHWVASLPPGAAFHLCPMKDRVVEEDPFRDQHYQPLVRKAAIHALLTDITK